MTPSGDNDNRAHFAYAYVALSGHCRLAEKHLLRYHACAETDLLVDLIMIMRSFDVDRTAEVDVKNTRHQGAYGRAGQGFHAPQLSDCNERYIGTVFKPSLVITPDNWI
jgi:hypothetical protein